MHLDTLRAITGIDIFPVISLVLFFAVFAVVLVHTARIKAVELSRLARLPLDDRTVIDRRETPMIADSSQREDARG